MTTQFVGEVVPFFPLMSLAHTSGFNFHGETISGKIQRDIVERFCTNKAMLFSTPYLKSRLSIVFSMQITADSLQRVCGFHVLVTAVFANIRSRLFSRLSEISENLTHN